MKQTLASEKDNGNIYCLQIYSHYQNGQFCVEVIFVFPMLILIRICISIRNRTHLLSKLAHPMPLEISTWNL